MHFQVRTDNHIPNNQELSDRVQAEVMGTLGNRWADQIRRVEVYFQDLNSHKQGIDTRCTVEVHLAGYQPVVVHDVAPTLEAALDAALEKLERTLERTLEKLEDRRDRISMSGQET
jgi:ribosome-associated translation inhibitor RaiA